MFLDVPLTSDLVQIQEKQQQLLDENLRRQNMKQQEYKYEVGQEILIRADDLTKLEPEAHGPYVVRQVYTNGTIYIPRNANVLKQINIRCVIPFCHI